MSEESEKQVVEWTFAGGWLLLLLIGLIVAWRTARHSPESYRALVPVVGVVTVVALIGSLALGSAYFPH